MVFVKSMIFTLFVVSSFITRGESLKCYNCQTQKGLNNPCENPKSDPTKVLTDTCTSDMICVQYSQKSTSAETITRGCRAKDVCASLKAQDSEFLKLGYCKTCTEDLCNSGSNSKLVISSFIFIISTLITTTIRTL